MAALRSFAMNIYELRDPFKLVKACWPNTYLYDKQRQIMASVCIDDETVVSAGNKLGKDYIAALVKLVFFLTRHPCRVLSTSVDGLQLAGVLWGELKRFLQTSVIPLTTEQGGPLRVNHMLIRKVYGGQECGLSYIMGRVAARGEGLQGHHIAESGDRVPRTLAVFDEASGIDDESYDAVQSWADRVLMIGNCWPCDNFFRRFADKSSRSVFGEDGHCYRRIIRITAEDSPNVRLAKAQIEAGLVPTGEILVPGVLPWRMYVRRRKLWDPVRQCVGLDAKFWEGEDTFLFVLSALSRCEALWHELKTQQRTAKAIGIDAGEGAANTCMCAVDERGVVELVSKKTPDTSVIPDEAIAFAEKHGVSAEQVAFDLGGGGRQHVYELRKRGFKCRAVGFGERVQEELTAQMHPWRSKEKRQEQREVKYTYFNRRAQMYGDASVLIEGGYAIPPGELKRQLSKIPKTYDAEGRLKLLPKVAPKGVSSLSKLLGKSPDEADAFVLAVHAMKYKKQRVVLGR